LEKIVFISILNIRELNFEGFVKLICQFDFVFESIFFDFFYLGPITIPLLFPLQQCHQVSGYLKFKIKKKILQFNSVQCGWYHV
ncbi:hypothetical protein DERP_000048, partial [Dermatophagoides pteronyssinus]